MTLKRSMIGAAGLVAIMALAGCTTGAKNATDAKNTTNTTDKSGPHATTTAGGVGYPALSLTCDDFPAADLLAAVRDIAPSAKMRPGPPPAEATDDDGRQCRYELYTPGTDLSSADFGLVEISVQVRDAWPDVLLSTDQGTGQGTDRDADRDAKANRDAFADEKASSKAAYDGSTENDATGQYYDVSGVGEGAFIEDVVHSDDSGNPVAYTADLEALRTPRPYRLDVGVSYVIANATVPDGSLDTAMTDRTKRDDLAKALAQIVLAKLAAHA